PFRKKLQLGMIRRGRNAAHVESELASFALDRFRGEHWVTVRLKPDTPYRRLVPGDELPKHVRQNAAVAKRHQLFRRIASRERHELCLVIPDRADRHLSHWRKTVSDTDDVKKLAPGEFQRSRGD